MIIVKETILFVHQSADLYGSDRVLLALVSKLDSAKFYPIVLLPMDGPLVGELKAAGVECHVVQITRLSRATLSFRGLLGLPFNLLKSMREMDRVLGGRSIDIVHSNTLAVLSSPLWARWHGVPHIWHVHEIIISPKFVRKAYSYLLSWFADCIVCVSQATKANLEQDKPALGSKIRVVWNGLERGASVNKDVVRTYREQISRGENEVVVALVGRINRLKGQILLIEAAGLLWEQGIRNVRYLLVGSAPHGQDHFLVNLKLAIAESVARSAFTLQGFTPNVWTVWEACDIAVIPSTEPESFGLVAVEAMAVSKPVIATRHGGVAEIVVNGETGLLVTPSSATELAQAINSLVVDVELRKRLGAAGELRYRKEFTLVRYVENMSHIYSQY